MRPRRRVSPPVSLSFSGLRRLIAPPHHAQTNPGAAVAAELRAHGRWSLAFDAYPGVKFGVVVDGECRIAVRGRAAKTLRAGDVVLLGGAPPYVMASDMETPSRSANDFLRGTKKRVARLGSVGEKPIVHIVGARFALDRANAHLLVDVLPELVRIPADEATLGYESESAFSMAFRREVGRSPRAYRNRLETRLKVHLRGHREEQVGEEGRLRRLTPLESGATPHDHPHRVHLTPRRLGVTSLNWA